MVPNRYRIIILVLVGVVLLANPFYLYPDGGGAERTYDVVALTDNSSAEDALLDSDRVLRCPGERVCAIEEQIIENGSVEYDHTPGQNGYYDVVGYVATGERTWYVPEADGTGDRTVLTLREVPPTKAVEHVAVSISDPAPEIRAGVTAGSITVHGEPIDLFEDREIIEYEGAYYAATGSQSSTHWTQDHGLLTIRLFLFASGVVMIAAGWWWAGRTPHARAGE